MTNICSQCGTPVGASARFCSICGASSQPNPSVSSATRVAGAPAPAGSSGILKLVVILGIIFAGGVVALGAVFYAAHVAKAKLGQIASSATGTETGKASGFSGNACALLSKEEVSNAIGVPVVEAKNSESGCEYLARGTQAEMTAKHVSAMMGTRGADKKTRDTMEQIAGGFFSNMGASDSQDHGGTDGTVPVLVFSVDTNAAKTQLHLNAKGLGRLGATEWLDGIGDEAFNSADSMLMFRKGDKLVRFMYMTCPCGLQAVRPLAQRVAAGL